MTQTNQPTEYYNITDPDGREWTLRPVPSHFYLMFGQLPATISERALLALKDGDDEAFEQEITSKLYDAGNSQLDYVRSRSGQLRLRETEDYIEPANRR